jgi:tripeptide aminopeptidase
MTNASPVTAWARHEGVQAARRTFVARLDAIAGQIVAVQQIAAPTFAEGARAAYVAEQFQQLGLQDVDLSADGNVYGRLPGHSPDKQPLVVSAHLDTVFPAGTDLAYQRDGMRLAGPGMADNSTGVTGLLLMAETLRNGALAGATARDIWFVANVGEEGLGDLCGMKAVVERFGAGTTYIVVEGGAFGHIIHQAVGSHRLRITVTAPGGHSWSDFGRPSAIHMLGRLIAAVDQIAVPKQPKTSYNVGQISGGLSINTIAPQAAMLLDLRSVEPAALTALVEQVNELVTSMGAAQGVTVTAETIGRRPAGQLARRAPLVQWAVEAWHQVGCRRLDYAPGSTDANIPLSLGYDAVCVGLATAGRVHHPEEYLDLTHLPDGLTALLLLLLAASA